MNMGLVGNKWLYKLLESMVDGYNRFNGIKRKLCPVTSKQLVITLKILQDNGMILRVDDNISTYILTKKGKRLFDLLSLIKEL
jgi:DNA-binding HxlR family transcriptional regulator